MSYILWNTLFIYLLKVQITVVYRDANEMLYFRNAERVERAEIEMVCSLGENGQAD